MEKTLKNLIDVKTGKLVAITVCGCTDCVEKYERIEEMGRQAAQHFRDMMSTEDHGIYDGDVDHSHH